MSEPFVYMKKHTDTHTHTPGQYLAAKGLPSWKHYMAEASLLSSKICFSLYILGTNSYNSKAKHRDHQATLFPGEL